MSAGVVEGSAGPAAALPLETGSMPKIEAGNLGGEQVKPPEITAADTLADTFKADGAHSVIDQAQSIGDARITPAPEVTPFPSEMTSGITPAPEDTHQASSEATTPFANSTHTPEAANGTTPFPTTETTGTSQIDAIPGPKAPDAVALDGETDADPAMNRVGEAGPTTSTTSTETTTSSATTPTPETTAPNVDNGTTPATTESVVSNGAQSSDAKSENGSLPKSPFIRRIGESATSVDTQTQKPSSTESSTTPASSTTEMTPPVGDQSVGAENGSGAGSVGGVAEPSTEVSDYKTQTSRAVEDFRILWENLPPEARDDPMFDDIKSVGIDRVVKGKEAFYSTTHGSSDTFLLRDMNQLRDHAMVYFGEEQGNELLQEAHDKGITPVAEARVGATPASGEQPAAVAENAEEPADIESGTPEEQAQKAQEAFTEASEQFLDSIAENGNELLATDAVDKWYDTFEKYINAKVTNETKQLAKDFVKDMLNPNKMKNQKESGRMKAIKEKLAEVGRIKIQLETQAETIRRMNQQQENLKKQVTAAEMDYVKENNQQEKNKKFMIWTGKTLHLTRYQDAIREQKNLGRQGLIKLREARGYIHRKLGLRNPVYNMFFGLGTAFAQGSLALEGKIENAFT